MGESLIMRSWIVFFASIFLACTTLFVERFFGIDWDFHPDSVTYATKSLEMMGQVHDNFLVIFDTGHYYWMAILGMSVGWGIAFNMIFYSITNVLLYNALSRLVFAKANLLLFSAFFVFVFNPYRLHLSTTILKDTIIILFLTFLLLCRGRLLSLFLLFCWRVGVLLYLLILVPRKWFYWIFIPLALLVAVNHAYIVEYARNQDLADMQFRDFDLVPAFKEFGFLGTIMRMLMWPFFALTGVFAIVSPSIFFYPLAIGSLSSLVLCLFVVKHGGFLVWIQIIISMSLFAFFATGFTTYIRYVYPVISLLPLFVMFHIQKNGHESKN